jgi:hypothetical protein
VHTCPRCEATYVLDNDSCEARWQTILALDHSRQSPWGPLHALSFATYTLQHAGSAARGTTARSWELLERVIGRGEPLDRVVADFRRRGAVGTRLASPVQASPRAFAVTIADLDEFDAATFESDLMRWARATHDTWAGRVLPPHESE